MLYVRSLKTLQFTLRRSTPVHGRRTGALRAAQRETLEQKSPLLSQGPGDKEHIYSILLTEVYCNSILQLVYPPTFLNIFANPRALEARSLISTNSSLKLRQESPMASLRGGSISELNYTTVQYSKSSHLLLSGFSEEV